MEEHLAVRGGGPAWSLGLFTRQKVPNDVPIEDADDMPSRHPQADHIRSFIRSPRAMPEHPSLDSPLLGLQQNDGNGCKPTSQYHQQHESVLLEDWLNLMLKRPSPPVTSRYSLCMSVDADDTGLTEYNLSRQQLARYGLSEAEVERGYRMLYVYSAGCYEVIKELCFHSLGKSFLVGCFWRAYIRLCEEQSKIGLRVEIADLVDQKKQAQDELRVTRGCLNGALDRLSLEFMKQIQLSETLAEGNAMEDTRLQEVRDLERKLKNSEGQIHDLEDRCSKAEQSRAEAIAQAVEATTISRRAKLDKQAHQSLGANVIDVQAVDATRMMKRAKLDEHNASLNEAKKIDEVDSLKAKLLKLQEALALEKDHAKKLQQSFARVQEELYKEERRRKEADQHLQLMNQLDQQLRQKISQVAHLENEIDAMRKAGSDLRAENADLLLKLASLDQEMADCNASMARMRLLVREKTRICDEKVLEATFLADEVQSWVQGNENLLAEQEKIVLEVGHLRGLLAEKKSEKLEATHMLESLINKKDKSIHALTVGVVALARMAQARPRFITLRPSVLEKMKAAVERYDKGVGCTPSSILMERLDEAGEDFYKLTAELHKMEDSTKEERNKRSWLEKQSNDTWRLLSQQNLRLSDADQRVANLAFEKRTVEQLLSLAEDELTRLRGRVTELRMVNEDQSKGIARLQNEVAESTAQQNTTSAELQQLGASLATETQVRMSLERSNAALEEKVRWLDSCLRDMTDKYNRTLAKKVKWKGIANDNATIIADLRAQVAELRKALEPLLARNRELEYMIKDEKNLREEAERMLQQLMAENKNLKEEVKGLESMLKTAKVEKKAITRRVTHLSGENECLKSERTKEMRIREILQNEVDALRLLTESLKIKLLEIQNQVQNIEKMHRVHADQRDFTKAKDVERSKELDNEVQNLERKIEALLANRVAEVDGLKSDIDSRLSAAHTEKETIKNILEGKVPAGDEDEKPFSKADEGLETPHGGSTKNKGVPEGTGEEGNNRGSTGDSSRQGAFCAKPADVKRASGGFESSADYSGNKGDHMYSIPSRKISRQRD